MNAIVSGKQVKVGDYVSFKNGIEQDGKIVKIAGNTLIIAVYDEDEDDTTHVTELASDCWI